MQDCPNFANATIIAAGGVQQACFADLFNGCGTDEVVARVPQAVLGSTYLGHGVDFTSCCNSHDNCYGTPGAAKAACDTGLRACILTTQCTRIPTQDIIHLEECRVNADTYYGLVRDFGDTAFRATQKDATKYTAQCLAHAAAP